MASADVQAVPAESAPADLEAAVPDYLANPNAVLGDTNVRWRYGRAPDYSKTRKVWEETKKMSHEPLSLPQLVENLVKNWEVEASFKPQLSDWRTVDHAKYTFAINGGPPQTAEHMLKVGTYNAIIAPNEYYSPEHSDFASSHKTFKRMMPTFAWEVLEVYSGPPKVAFKWRHWGTMKNDYVGFNDKGEKVTAKAHGGPIDITGITIATVNDKVQLQEVNTYFDPLDMFRQMAPGGIVNKEIMNKNVDKETALDASALSSGGPIVPTNDGVKIAQEYNGEHAIKIPEEPSMTSEAQTELLKDIPRSQYSSSVTGDVEAGLAAGIKGEHTDDSTVSGTHDDVDKLLEQFADAVHPHPKTMEETVQPEPGQAVATPADSVETRMTHEEMSNTAPSSCPFLLNRE